MKTKFKLGQIFCSKHKTASSKGEYYVVIQEESDSKRLASFLTIFFSYIGNILTT
jgi:hypothetical protein